MFIGNKCNLTFLLALLGGGCAQRHPITVETVEPWQKSYEESVEAPPQTQPLPSPSMPSASQEDSSSRPPEPLAFVSDVLAFPFRGIGWLVQKIF